MSATSRGELARVSPRRQPLLKVGGPRDGACRQGWLIAGGGVPATAGWAPESRVPVGVGVATRVGWATDGGSPNTARPIRADARRRPCRRHSRRAASSGKPSSVGPTQAWLPAVGGVPATAGGPLRVGCPRQSGLPPGWSDYRWRFSQYGSPGAGGMPAPPVVQPPQQARSGRWDILRRARFQVGGLPPAGRPCWWCGRLRPRARTRRRVAGSGSASRVGLPAATLWMPVEVVRALRC